jgi:hypothetical protein
MATPATARALGRGNALLRRDSPKSLTAKKGRSMASPINAPLSKLRALMGTPIDIDAKTSIGQYSWIEGGKKHEAWGKSIHIGSDRALTPRMVQRAVLLPTFSTAIFFERIGVGRVPAVGVCDGGRSTEICLRLVAMKSAVFV